MAERFTMTGRFTALPSRLRAAADVISCGEEIELTEALSISSLLGDAALKIEALERQIERYVARDLAGENQDINRL